MPVPTNAARQEIHNATIFLHDGYTEVQTKMLQETPCKCKGEIEYCKPGKCDHPPRYRKECNPTCGQLCKARQIPHSFDFARPIVQRKDGDSFEQGVAIAIKEFRVRKFIACYRGIVVPNYFYERDWKREGYGRPFFMEYLDGFVLDAKRYGSDIKFAKHSCTPNCEAQIWYEGNLEGIFTPVVIISAKTAIKLGEELSITYNVNNLEELPKMVCTCGKPTCPDFTGSKEEEPMKE